MRIFVIEYITGGGLVNERLGSELLGEAETMVSALLADLGDTPDVQLLVSRDPRLSRPRVPCELVSPREGDDVWKLWRLGMEGCDAVWPVMPETGGLLERVSRLALDAGCRLIGSRPDAVRIAASKLWTSACLCSHGIPVVPTYAVAEPVSEPAARWVSKPDDGVGCEGIRVFETLEALAAALDPEALGNTVVQPYMEGTPASLSLLCHAGEARLLSCNLQQVAEEDGRLHLRRIRVNGLGHRDGCAELGRAIARAIPDLWGYVGVDLICTDSGPRVLEINPRLTVSYAGLRAALNINPAGLVLRLLREGPAVLADWSAGAAGRAVNLTVACGA